MNQSLAAAVEPRNFETDFNLLTVIGCAEYDREAAEEALRELYDRHAPRLKASGVAKRWETLGIDVDELVITTFEKIWNRAGAFDPLKAHCHKDRETAVSLWIYRIFENGFRDELRAIKRGRANAPQALSSDDIVLDAEEEEATGDGMRLKPKTGETQRVGWTRQWLDCLSEGDRQIMLLSADYINPATRECEIPGEELQALADRLKLAPASIKVKRGRLKIRLIAFISEKENHIE
jgi:RNA polymerase sigma factor (sigma-70 family)